MRRSAIPDYYSILNVLPSARHSEIAKAYKKLVTRYHPDKHADNELKELAEEKLRQLNEAFETLSDPGRRAAYDAERRGVASASASVRTASGQTSAPFPFARTLTLLAVIAGVFLAIRFIRSPRALAVIGIVIAIAWFGPRIIRKLRNRK